MDDREESYDREEPYNKDNFKSAKKAEGTKNVGSQKVVGVLKFAESLDALRVVPRLILGCYLVVVYQIILWYIDFEVQTKTICDSEALKVLLDKGVPVEDAHVIACTVSEVIGHPTGYTALVTVMVGAAAVVFGLYTNSGRSWQGNNSMKDHI